MWLYQCFLLQMDTWIINMTQAWITSCVKQQTAHEPQVPKPRLHNLIN